MRLLVGAVAHLVLGRLHVRVVLHPRKRVVRRLVLRLRLRPAAARVVLLSVRVRVRLGLGLGWLTLTLTLTLTLARYNEPPEEGAGKLGTPGALVPEVSTPTLTLTLTLTLP